MEQPSKAASHTPPDQNLIRVGKDILELLSTAMYADPLVVYREYIQNATDSIDEASAKGLYDSTRVPEIRVHLDHASRTVRVTDNGTGVPHTQMRKLLSFGASTKRHGTARGFRGVGRLAGLAYCQELVMRTRALGESQVTEVRWDCVRMKQLLADPHYDGSLDDIVTRIASLAPTTREDAGPHFFEVEMRKVARIANDILLNEPLVARYLRQVAPVPFSEDFSFTHKIDEFLSSHGVGVSYRIFIGDSDKPLTRPFTNMFTLSPVKSDRFTQLETVTLPDIEDGLSAVGWVLHHGYHGALPSALGFKGIRLRQGNVQVGGSSLLADAFPQPRFNSWSVGELHVVSKRIVPNGRRDNFEPNAAYFNLHGQFQPLARAIAVQCQRKSKERSDAQRLTPEAVLDSLPRRLRQSLREGQLQHIASQPQQKREVLVRVAEVLLKHYSNPSKALTLIDKIIKA